MKAYLLIATILFTTGLWAQTPCEFSIDVKDSIGTYQETRDYLMYERNFAGTAAYAYFSLVRTDGMPTVNVQFITKSKEFVKANCLDKNSRMYLQLDNGKVITLLHIDKQDCGTSVRDINGNNNIIMTGVFMFMKNSLEDLKSSPVSVMRIKYSSDTADYILKTEFVSELDGKTYKPAGYFTEMLHCILD